MLDVGTLTNTVSRPLRLATNSPLFPKEKGIMLSVFINGMEYEVPKGRADCTLLAWLRGEPSTLLGPGQVCDGNSWPLLRARVCSLISSPELVFVLTEHEP